MFSIFDGRNVQCVLLTRSNVVGYTLSVMLEENDSSLMIVHGYSHLSETIAQGIRIDYAFIDVDSNGRIASQYSRLRHIRDLHPALPTILISSDFETDEFSAHRLFLGDVSLRIPVTYYSLEIGLLQASINNEIWRSRFGHYGMERAKANVAVAADTGPVPERHSVQKPI